MSVGAQLILVTRLVHVAQDVRVSASLLSLSNEVLGGAPHFLKISHGKEPFGKRRWRISRWVPAALARTVHQGELPLHFL